MMGTTVILVMMILLKTVLSLDITCGRGASSARFGKEMRCVCREGIYGETSGDERFSEIFNVKLRDLSAVSRPVSQKVSHILLSNCGEVRLIMDLANLRIDEADITDISFEDINDLYINFESGGGFGSGSNYMKYVFTNINNLEMTGVIQNQNEMRMFIRNNDINRITNVIFQQIKVDTPIRLLNIQDVTTLRVVNSDFGNIQTLEVRNAATRCYLTRDGSVVVPCTKNQLFYGSNYIRPLVEGGSNLDDGKNGGNNISGSDMPTNNVDLVDQVTQRSALTDGVVSNPLFIVGMVLIVAVVLISILVVMYIRYHKRYSLDDLRQRPPRRDQDPTPIPGSVWGRAPLNLDALTSRWK